MFFDRKTEVQNLKKREVIKRILKYMIQKNNDYSKNLGQLSVLQMGFFPLFW